MYRRFRRGCWGVLFAFLCVHVCVCVFRNLSHCCVVCYLGRIFVSVAESMVATLKATYENTGVCVRVSLCVFC